MKRYIAFIIAMASFTGMAQSRVIAKVTDALTHAPVAANIQVKETNQGWPTDSLGISSIQLQPGKTYAIMVSAIAYRQQSMVVTIPYEKDTLYIALIRLEEEMDEVIVQSTRTSRTIANVPTRIETIALEEIDEKNNMRPANVAMLLHESTGIQVQQTSATSGNASIRMQGLDGRYTQLLKDGFPHFGNFSGGLSVLEIPPLDLRQVEIIKGPASPLYGGGAIAGVINFISKTPKDKPEYNFLFNQSTIGQSNAGAFLSKKSKKTGYTLLALFNTSKAYDVDKDDFSEVPRSSDLTLHPRLFVYLDKKTTLIVGNSFTAGKRIGGDIEVVKYDTSALHQYFEKNSTRRNISTLELEKNWSNNRQLIVKQSFSVFSRTIDIPGYTFGGIEYNGFADISYVVNAQKHALVGGGNFVYNRFAEKKGNPGKRNDRLVTAGLYAQHTWDATEGIKLESGLRLDITRYSNVVYSRAEAFVLPRISLLIKYNPRWSSRVGGGIGYKTPSLFTEETETIQFRDVAALEQARAERSYGATADVNFKMVAGSRLNIAFNQLFFYTTIYHSLLLENDGPGNYRLINAGKPVQSAGMETNVKFIYKDYFRLFLGYTFTSARAGYLPGRSSLPLVPKHKLNTALIYEKEGSVKIGLEAYVTGKQHLKNGTGTPAFSEFGFMGEKIFKKFSVFINLENFTDTRQSRYKNVVNGSHLHPVFDEIWTHTEGFVANAGFKIKL